MYVCYNDFRKSSTLASDGAAARDRCTEGEEDGGGGGAVLNFDDD